MYYHVYSIILFLYLQITIPDADTTYWCAAFKIPENIRNQTRYVTKVRIIVHPTKDILFALGSDGAEILICFRFIL